MAINAISPSNFYICVKKEFFRNIRIFSFPEHNLHLYGPNRLRSTEGENGNPEIEG